MGAKRSLLARHSQVRSACPLAGRLCGAIALGKAICLPWVRARGAHGKTACARANGMAFGDPMAGGLRGGVGRWGPWLAKGGALRASPFLAHFTAGGLCAVRVPWAKPFAFHGCAHRARTAKQRAHGPMAWLAVIQWRVAFGAGMPIGNAIALPLVRAPCAHQRNAVAIALGWALRTHGMPLARPKNFRKPPCAWSADLLSFGRQQTGRALARSAMTSCCLGMKGKKE